MRRSPGIVMAVALGAALVACAPFSPAQQPTVACVPVPVTVATVPGARADVTSPADGATVGASFAVAARLDGAVPKGHELWSLVQIEGPAGHPAVEVDGCAATERVWPGPEPLHRDGDEVTGPASCGANVAAHTGLRCRLTIVVVDRVASDRFAAYNRDAAQGGYPGLGRADLVGEIRALGSVTVVRGAHTAGPTPTAGTAVPCDAPDLAFPAGSATGRLSRPTHGAVVSQVIPVGATITGVPPGMQAWTLVQIVGPPTHPTVARNDCTAVTRVWPSPQALAPAGSERTGYAFCAGPTAADAGVVCRLTLVLADATASAQFRAYARDAPALEYPGLAPGDLVGAVQILDSVTVTRNADRLPPGLPTAPPGPPQTPPSTPPSTPTESGTPALCPAAPALPIPTAQGVVGSIGTPGQGATVGQPFPVTATVVGIPEGYQPWTLVQIVGPADHPVVVAHDCVAITRVWPGPGAMEAGGDGTYSRYAFCGGPSDAGLTCRLTLVIVDETAAAAFAAYQAGAASQGYPGLAHGQLTGDIRRVAAVTVTRA